MKNLKYREILTNEYEEIYLKLFKKNNYSIFYFFILGFLVLGFYPIFKSTGNNFLLTFFILAIILCILYLVVFKSYFSMQQRKRFFNQNKIKACNVLCVDIKKSTSHSGNYTNYIYSFVDESGHKVKIRNPHILNSKPKINDVCLILNFNNKYFSVF